MIRYLILISILICALAPGTASAQQEWRLLTESAEGVAVYGDPRLPVLTRKRTPESSSRRRGYRLQIYSGTDRKKAMEIRNRFMQEYPGTRTYMTYVQPQFRVKAGNYASREEAARMYRKISSAYAPCMIVPDAIELNTSRDDE